MKINRLFLHAFGCFTGVTLDFSGRDQGLNIIFGPNEAGKSTAMRAIDSFFFGFGHTTPDAWLHGYKDLAVGAELETGSGRIMELTRYKRNKNDLVDRDGRPVDPSVMNAVMTGLTRDMYANMFGLDHQSLRLGAREILAGGGHLGETLFTAASGITSLRLSMEEFRKRADDLFTPRAFSRPVWKNISRISELGRELRRMSVRPEQWRSLVLDQERNSRAREEIEDRIRDMESSINRHTRFYQALSLIKKLEGLKAELRDFESIPDLAPDFAETRARVQDGIARLRPELNRLQDRENKLAAELESTTVHEKILDHADGIRRLYHRTSAIAQARENILQLDQEVNILDTSIREKSGHVSALPNFEGAHEPRISSVLAGRLEDLARDLSSIQTRISQVERETGEWEKELVLSREQLEGLGNIPGRKDLEAVSRKLAQVPEIMDAERKSGQRVEQLSTALEKRVRALVLWQGSLEELAGLALPLQETMEDFHQQLLKAEKDLDAAGKDLKNCQSRIQLQKKELEQMDFQEALPSRDTLVEARTFREHGWSLIKSAWMEGREDQPAIEEFMSRTGADTLAHAFEKAQVMADDTADSLLKKADKVAARAGIVKDLAELEKTCQGLDEDFRSRSDRHAQILDRWRSVWLKLGIEPLSPREMSAWTVKVNEIRRMQDDLENERMILKKIQERLSDLTALAKDVLHRHDFSFDRGTDLVTLCSLVESALESSSRLAEKKTGLERDLGKARASVSRLLSSKKELFQELEEKQSEWASALTGTGIDHDLKPRHALEEMRIIREIISLREQRNKLAQQKAGLEKMCREFAGQVLGLIKTLDYVPQGRTSPEDLVAWLHVRLENEHKKVQHRENLIQDLAGTRESISRTRTELDVLEAQVKQLCTEAGIDDPDLLPETAQKSRHKKNLEQDLKNLMDRLGDVCAGEDLEIFMARAGEFDPDQLQALLSGLQGRNRELMEERDRIIEEKREIEVKLREMDGTSRVLEVEQDIQEQKAQLEDRVNEYVRLRLAAEILTAEVERYRIANQGPVLERAGDIFRKITLGSFAGIIADFDDKGDPVLKAVRAPDQRLGVEDLSEGSRDQLFLALRLGGVYRFLDDNRTFPFMVDDILVHFDDQRSLETLSVLAELSGKTQVLFFTHHRHLVDLALQIPDKNRVSVHEL